MSQATSGPSAPASPSCGPLLAPAPGQSGAGPHLPKVVRADRVGDKIDLGIEPEGLCAVFGVADPSVATHLLSQLVRFIQPDPRKPVDAASINQVLALMEGIGPGDTIEAMTVTMLVGAQHAALDSLRRASHPDQTPAGRQSYTALGLKAMRTFAQLVEALHVGRGKAVRQEINVTHQHVTVEAGGRAMVGAIDARGEGG
jgi:hypothetical protein